MEKNDTVLVKQLFIFSSILFLGLSVAYILSTVDFKLKDFAQHATAVANDAGESFKFLMTEDLNKYLDE